MPYKQPVALALALLSGAALAQQGRSFDQIDTDGNGYIDAKEFGGGPVGKQIFDEWDRNGDGRIDHAEWKAAVALNGD